jgi:hypothetical protein
MRYGPTDSHRPPHPDRHRDCGLFGAGGLQDLDEAGRPESGPRELSGSQFDRGRIPPREHGDVHGRPSLSPSLLGNRRILRRLVRYAAARDSLGHLTGPGATVAGPEPDPDTAQRDPKGQPHDVRPDKFCGPAKRLAQAASRDQGA